MTKADFRRHLRSKIDQLTFPDLIGKSGALSARFQDWSEVFKNPLFSKKTILSFYPFGSEPQIQIEQSPFEIAYPRIENWDKREMLPRVARRDLPGQWEEIELPGGNKIFQPIITQALCKPSEISAVLVPGLGFTAQGDRLGRGAGFYDRFLAQVPDALRVGVAFDLQIIPDLPTDSHDLPVDIILTETRLIETNRYSQWKNHGRIERE